MAPLCWCLHLSGMSGAKEKAPPSLVEVTVQGPLCASVTHLSDRITVLLRSGLTQRPSETTFGGNFVNSKVSSQVIRSCQRITASVGSLVTVSVLTLTTGKDSLQSCPVSPSLQHTPILVENYLEWTGPVPTTYKCGYWPCLLMSALWLLPKYWLKNIFKTPRT